MAPVEYEDVQATSTQRAEVDSWGWESTSDGWVKRGACPRCGHPIIKTLQRVNFALSDSFDLPIDMVAESHAGRSGKAALLPAAPRKVKVFCNCSAKHDDGKKGCGFYVFDIPGP